MHPVTSATRNYQSEIVNRTTPVSEMHLLEVRDALSDDLIRYMHKHSLKFNGDTGAIEKNDPEKSVSESKIKRIKILQKALNEMEDYRSIKNKNEKINYSTFFAKIDSWQNEIIQAHSKKRQATFMFTFLQPKGLKKMGEVSEKIKTEGPFVPKMRPSK